LIKDKPGEICGLEVEKDWISSSIQLHASKSYHLIDFCEHVKVEDVSTSIWNARGSRYYDKL